MPRSTPSPRRVFQYLVPLHVEVEDGLAVLGAYSVIIEEPRSPADRL
jgi:hypothetical protein